MRNIYVLALLAYVLFSCTDALVKATGRAHLSVFEISFVINVVAFGVLLATRHEGERWRDFLRTDHTRAVHGRAICGVISGLAAIYAFTSIPMAEAYSIIFLSPAFVTILSALVLKERIGIVRWSSVALGFAGVLMVLRPGAQNLAWGHLGALATGLAMSGSIIILRGAGRGAKSTSILGTLLLYLLVVSGTMMVVKGVALPTGRELGLLAMAGMAYGLGQWAFLMAPRFGTASQMAPVHYVQLVCAVLFGAVFFSEYPDAMTLAGVGVIAASGLVTLARERRAARLRMLAAAAGKA